MGQIFEGHKDHSSVTENVCYEQINNLFHYDLNHSRPAIASSLIVWNRNVKTSVEVLHG